LAQEKSFEKVRKLAKAHSSNILEADNRLAFVVRIKGIKYATPKVRKALLLLKLRQINNGVFVRLNKPTVNLLRLVEPYVTWGYPSMQNVRDLIYKRGHVRVKDDRMAITGNAIIETEMSKYDMISVEDLIDELWKVGPHFVEVNNFIWPFKLRAPKEGHEGLRKSFVMGGSYGNRADAMPDLIQKML
jgi:large subunit ribosomal protein L7e